MVWSFLRPCALAAATLGRPAAQSAANCLETPRVSWAVGWEFSGRSSGGQIGPLGPTSVLHAAGARRIARLSGASLSHVAAHKSSTIRIIPWTQVRVLSRRTILPIALYNDELRSIGHGCVDLIGRTCRMQT